MIDDGRFNRATPERTTLTSSLTREPSTSCALERVRSGSAHWLTASATRLMHPDKQVRVVFSRPDVQEIFEVLLSGPEAEAAIRQLMQAYADSIGKSLNFCAYPGTKGVTVDAVHEEGCLGRYGANTCSCRAMQKERYRAMSKRQYEGRAHRGITRDWNHICTDNDCWCWGSEWHNPR